MTVPPHTPSVHNPGSPLAPRFPLRKARGMTASAQEFEPGPEDPSRQLLDALRAAGPRALAEMLGNQTHVLAALAAEPEDLLDPGAHATTDFSELVARLHEQAAALEVLEARAMVALADATHRELRAEEEARAAQEAGDQPSPAQLEKRAYRTTVRDLSMATRRSPSGAGRTLAARRRLVESMPTILGAMNDGRLRPENAHFAARAVGPLTPAQREEVDRRLGARLPYLGDGGSAEWEREVGRQIEKVDPAGQARRHQHARRSRSVTVRRGQHGMATLSAHIPGLDAARIRKRLSREAERRRAQGDRRGHQAIQADSLVDTLIGRDTGMETTELDIGVIITDRALLDPAAGDIAQIEGYGPVPAEAVREEMREALAARRARMDELLGEDGALGEDGPELRAVLRRLYTHPTTGELVAVESVARAFPAALARYLLWRDVTCRGPHCDAPIRQSDHIVPHSRGGPTSLDNGQGLCGFCNDKEQQTRSVTREDDPEHPGHRVTWISRTGITATTGAEALTEPVGESMPGAGPELPDQSEPPDVQEPPDVPDPSADGSDETGPSP